MPSLRSDLGMSWRLAMPMISEGNGARFLLAAARNYQQARLSNLNLGISRLDMIQVRL